MRKVNKAHKEYIVILKKHPEDVLFRISASIHIEFITIENKLF
jgi:hypothetical protein